MNDHIQYKIDQRYMTIAFQRVSRIYQNVSHPIVALESNDLNAIVPLQSTPEPSNPVLQVQKKDPCVFVQVAYEWQLSLSSRHSLMSKK